MTKSEFLKRCETIYIAELASEEVFKLLNRWVDAIMRLEGGQTGAFATFLNYEKSRLLNFLPSKVLANDVNGYKIIQLAAILSHPCQDCAEDKAAWWTRSGFCTHVTRKKA